jgi:hypothetical protein
MENRNARTTSTNRNGLNLGLSTKFAVAHSVDSMAYPDQDFRVTHPATQPRRVGSIERGRPIAIALEAARRSSALDSWPTERACGRPKRCASKRGQYLAARDRFAGLRQGKGFWPGS